MGLAGWERLIRLPCSVVLSRELHVAGMVPGAAAAAMALVNWPIKAVLEDGPVLRRQLGGQG